MKIYITEEWAVPRYDVFKDGELNQALQDNCKEVEVPIATGKHILHYRDQWRETEETLAGLFRPKLLKKVE